VCLGHHLATRVEHQNFGTAAQECAEGVALVECLVDLLTLRVLRRCMPQNAKYPSCQVAEPLRYDLFFTRSCPKPLFEVDLDLMCSERVACCEREVVFTALGAIGCKGGGEADSYRRTGVLILAYEVLRPSVCCRREPTRYLE